MSSFPRKNRLVRQAEFAAAFANRCVAAGEFFLLHGRPNGTDAPRLGVVVGRKAAALAVERNRVKRQVRETFRLRQAGVCGLDIVVTLRKNYPRARAVAAREELSRLFLKIERCRS